MLAYSPGRWWPNPRPFGLLYSARDPTRAPCDGVAGARLTACAGAVKHGPGASFDAPGGRTRRLRRPLEQIAAPPVSRADASGRASDCADEHDGALPFLFVFDQPMRSPSSVISKAVVEEFTARFLKQPGVIWLSESRNQVVARDDRLAQAIGLAIDPGRNLPTSSWWIWGPPSPCSSSWRSSRRTVRSMKLVRPH